MIIQHPEHPHALEIDETSGLPMAILQRTGERPELCDFELSLIVGGLELRSPTGGLDYQGTTVIEGSRLEGSPTWASDRDGDRCHLPIQIGTVAAHLECLFRRHGPGVSLAVVLIGDSTSSLLIRDLKVGITFQLPGDQWTLNAPGNGLARDVRLGDVTAWTGISGIGGLRGSSAVMHLGAADRAAVIWFRHELEVCGIRIKSQTRNTLDLDLATNFAGDLGRIARAQIDLFDLDLRAAPYPEFPAQFQSWLRLSGHSTPMDAPDWIASASIFEAQLGFSVFWPNHRYEPYPDVSALTGDLERIAGLGFKVDLLHRY